MSTDEIDWQAAAHTARQRRLALIREAYQGIEETRHLRLLFFLVANETSEETFRVFLALPNAMRQVG